MKKIKFFTIIFFTFSVGYFTSILLSQVYNQIFKYLLFIIGLWVAGWIILISKLEKSQDIFIKKFGKALGVAFQYTMLFQAIVYSVLVLWSMTIIIGYVNLPETYTEFLYDFIFGSVYFSIFVFASTGATVLLSNYKWNIRILGLMFSIVSTLAPLYLLIKQKEILLTLCNENPQLAIYSLISYFLPASIIGMYLLERKTLLKPQKLKQ